MMVRLLAIMGIGSPCNGNQLIAKDSMLPTIPFMESRPRVGALRGSSAMVSIWGSTILRILQSMSIVAGACSFGFGTTKNKMRRGGGGCGRAGAICGGQHNVGALI